MTELKVKGMLRSDGTLGLDPVHTEPCGWSSYVVYPVPRSVIESYETAMALRMQMRRLVEPLNRAVPQSCWTL